MENREQQILSEIKAMMASIRSQLEMLDAKMAELQYVVGTDADNVEPIDLAIDDIIDDEVSQSVYDEIAGADDAVVFDQDSVVVTDLDEPAYEVALEYVEEDVDYIDDLSDNSVDESFEPVVVAEPIAAEDVVAVEEPMAVEDVVAVEEQMAVEESVVVEEAVVIEEPVAVEEVVTEEEQEEQEEHEEQEEDDDLPFFTEPEPLVFKSVADAAVPRQAVLDKMIDKQAWRTDMPGSAVKDIRSAISLNDRILFINNLFMQDPVIFQDTLTKINQMTSLDQVVEYVVAEKPEWDLESDIVYRFMMAVRRKVR